jgi:hypothetical protein
MKKSFFCVQFALLLRAEKIAEYEKK